MEVSDIHVGKQLHCNFSPQGVIPIPPLCFGFGPTTIPGTGFFNGAVLVGNPLNFPIPNVPEATLMVGRASPLNNPLAAVSPSIFKISSKGSLLPPTPIDVVFGDPGIGIVGIAINSLIINIINTSSISIVSPFTNGIGALNWVGTKTLTGVEVLAGSKAQAGAEVRAGAKCTNAVQQINGALQVNGIIRTNVIEADLGVFKSVAAPFKFFDIPHPTKSGYRLAHTCLEGPEIAVYYRGKLNNSNIINLPEYWSGLVDSETITVSLTPHVYYQELFVKYIKNCAIIEIGNNSDNVVNCSYIVYGERKDVGKIKIEYKEKV